MPTELISDYLDAERAARLKGFCLVLLEKSPVIPIGRSRIARYGWDYDDPTKWLGDIPVELTNAIGQMECDHVTINEYERNRAIEPHIDSMKFGDEIRILSLGDPAVFCLHRPEPTHLHLTNGSLLRFWGDDRYKFQHSVFPVKGHRISLVFRLRK